MRVSVCACVCVLVNTAVYIEEAHPTDGWAFPDNVSIMQHRSLDDRLSAAAQLVASARSSLPANMSVVVDTMSNELSLAYGGLPDRLYVIHDGAVAFQGDPGPYGFRPEPVASWLQTHRRNILHRD